MAKTFRDLMVECATWEFSQERLEIMKETAELQLAEQYIANQMFMQENSDLFTAGVNFDEGYFAESVDDNTLSVLMEKTQEKGLSLLSKIWKGLLKVIRAIQRFFGRLAGKFDETNRMASDVLKKLRKMPADEAVMNDIIERVNVAKQKAGNFKPQASQPFLRKMGINWTTDPRFREARVWLACALSDTVVVADPIGSENGAFDNALSLPVPVLLDIAGTFKIESESNIQGAITNMTNEFKKVKTKGFVIDANPATVAKDTELIGTVYDELENKINAFLGKYDMALGAVGTAGAVAGIAKDNIPGMAAAAGKKVREGLKAAGAAAGKMVGKGKKSGDEGEPQTESVEEMDAQYNALYEQYITEAGDKPELEQAKKTAHAKVKAIRDPGINGVKGKARKDIDAAANKVHNAINSATNKQAVEDALNDAENGIPNLEKVIKAAKEGPQPAAAPEPQRTEPPADGGEGGEGGNDQPKAEKKSAFQKGMDVANSALVTASNTLYGLLNVSIGATLQIYTGYSSFRYALITSLNVYTSKY